MPIAPELKRAAWLRVALAALLQAPRSLPAAQVAQLALLLVTLAPEHDSPWALADCAAAFHPSLVGLTASTAQIAQVAKRHSILTSAVPPRVAATISITVRR